MAQITRRDFIKAAGGFVSAAALSPGILQDALAGENKRFNILFLMTDQHCHSVMGSAGNSVVRTPNLDRLARDGARFTNSVCATPFCTPTRASFITGQWPHTHGLVKNVNGDKGGLDDSVVATEQILFDKGYQTYQMGKWHIGNTRSLRCYRREQDLLDIEGYRQHRKALPEDVWSKARPGEVQIEDVAYTSEMAEFHHKWQEVEENRAGQDLSVIGRSLLPAVHSYESWLAARCIDLIRKYKEKNFMITYSVSPPHAFWTAPDPYYSQYDPSRIRLPDSYGEIPEVYRNSEAGQFSAALGEKRMREMLRCYYAQVTMMDWCFGRVLNALREEGLDENTLVVYTSDHGDMQGAHGMVCKSLPGYYEEIVRTPMIMRYPGVVKPGTVINSHVNTVDFMPTFLDFAGEPTPKSSQGVSLRPLLEGKATDDDRPGFSERGLGKEESGWSRMIRTQEWKYSYFAGGRRELFNLAKDPGEMKNLASDASAAADMKVLHKQLIAQAEKSNDPALVHLAKA